MPIHDQGYRRYAGRRLPHGTAWWVIARAGILERLRERRFLALLLLAWMPAIVRALQIYASASFGPLSFLAPGPETFRAFLDQQSLFLFFVTVYAGSGLIAGDRRAHALQLYLSKPLTRVQYVAGKLAGLAVFLLAAGWLPAMALVALQTLLSGSADLLRDHPMLVPAITAYCAIEVVVTALAVLALSSLSDSRRFVAIMYAGVIFFAAAMSQILGGITGSDRWAWLSPEAVFDALGIAVFQAQAEPAIPAFAAILALAATAGASLAVLARRVRPVDVVT